MIGYDLALVNMKSKFFDICTNVKVVKFIYVTIQKINIQEGK